MNLTEIADRVEKKFPGKVVAKKPEAKDPWIMVAPASLLEIARFLRDDPDLKFDYLRDLTAVDYLIADEKKAKKLAIEPHIEVVYQLFSFAHKHYLTLKVKLDRWQEGKPGALPELASVASIWAVADWHEREAYDLLGIQFLGHPNLRRILCPEDWVGHPLRKDYEFPLEYHGIRC